MGVYIKGMEMPANCFLCQLSYLRENRLFCYQTKDEVVRAKIADNCPLVPVPKHGRLIDADAAIRNGWTINRTYSASPTETVYEVKAIDCLPTIIPADEEED